MNLFDFAFHELKLVEEKCETEDSLKMQHEVTRGVLRVVRAFQKAGHSGSTAEYAINIIERVLRFKPITRLTGADDEWTDMSNYANNEILDQNIRCPAVFRKNHDNTTAYYVEAKLFSDDGGKTFYSNKDSSIPIQFPYLVPLYPEMIVREPKKRSMKYEPANAKRSNIEKTT